MTQIYDLERRLRRAGLAPVAGADEAGRGACAGPLVAGAAILRQEPRHHIAGLRDSKLLTERAREELYTQITAEAIAWSVVVIPAAEIDALGLQTANIQALRRALLRLIPGPEYALTDGFPVDGLGIPGLAIWKGDQVAACVSAASILAKVARDRMMVDYDQHFPQYGFAGHKGYSTKKHQQALDEYGPSPIHRLSYANVSKAAAATPSPR